MVVVVREQRRVAGWVCGWVGVWLGVGWSGGGKSGGAGSQGSREMMVVGDVDVFAAVGNGDGGNVSFLDTNHTWHSK